MPRFTPAYRLLPEGALEQRIAQAFERLTCCTICPRACKVNRRAGVLGICRTGERAIVSASGPHHGEEACISGWSGSGTIFFSRCNMLCQFCQNHEISQGQLGESVDAQQLAEIMLRLQDAGCHNVNLVTPSHVVPQILAALQWALRGGLSIPLVYNSGGYDSIETLKLLDGVVDIYLPDMKYASPQMAFNYSRARNYPAVNQAAVREMHRQVGDLQTGEDGLATRGLIVRHLVLPNDLGGSAEIARFLAVEISPDTALNLMGQYCPQFQAHRHPRLNRPITPAEYAQAQNSALNAGLHRFV